MAKLSLRNVQKHYANLQVVHGIDMEIGDGEFIVIVGPSGCGKSTLLRMVAGLEPITGGEVWIGDRVVNELEPAERDIAMVFQNYALYPHMSVYDNIGFALKLAKVPKDEIDQRVRKAADILELTSNLDRKPGQLSGGQRQRVGIARALMQRPKLFLVDEPTSSLDPKIGREIMDLMSRLTSEEHIPMLISVHDLSLSQAYSNRIVGLQDGKKVLDSKTSDVNTDILENIYQDALAD